MQEEFLQSKENINSLRLTLSKSRITRYMNECNGDFTSAMRLYHWNSKISESLYIPLQMWEVSLRNRLNGFLIWKYNQKWPYNERLRRNLTRNDYRRLTESIERQSQERRLSPNNVPVDPIVADLSAGFWVSLLSTSYDVPFVWRYNIQRLFPNEPRIERRDASNLCGSLLDIRNRIAHHEPVYHFDLANNWQNLTRILCALCVGGSSYIEANNSFQETFDARPT